MQLIDDRLVVSPTDLTNFLECEHLTQLDLAELRGDVPTPADDDPERQVVRHRGELHERRYLAHLEQQGLRVVRIEQPHGQRAEAFERQRQQTLAAMRQGADVIYQATFFSDNWLSHADFLRRVDEPSDLGPYSYEVADTKLARHVKVGALLQMCAYSEQLQSAQGRAPARVHVVLGDMSVESHRLADYAAYYRRVKQRFLATIARSPLSSYPLPVGHCAVCRWSECCAERRRTDDHLSLVAGLRRDHVRKLEASGIPTLSGLAACERLDAVKGIGDHTLRALRHQARLQLRQRETATVHYDLLPPDGPERGLAALPEPSPGDLFFDMEGDPWQGDEGLEYLFGLLDVTDGEPRYRTFWAHDPVQEKQALEELVDFIMDRLAEDPRLHVYHYGGYEVERIKRLMGRYGTRAEEVDRLLRGGVFVDLLQVVRQSVRVSQESYSIKMLEPLYGLRRETEIRGGGSSIVFYERWLETRDDHTLQAIADYNRDDCLSTWKLRDWLEERRVEAAARFGSIPRPAPRVSDPGERQAEQETRRAALADALLDGVPDDPAKRSDEQQARWLLAHLLDWHRREDRPEWWAYFDRLRKSDAELIDDPEAIGGLRYQGVVGQVKSSLVHRYGFNPDQEHKILEGSTPYDPATQRSAGTVVAVDSVHGTIDLKRGQRSDAPHPCSLIPPPPRDSAVLRDGLARCASWLLRHGWHSAGPYQAAADLLLRRPAPPGTVLQQPGEPGHEAARRLIAGWAAAGGLAGEHWPSVLAIQGPPGSGKTYTAARLVLDLVTAGWRVGVTASSHNAIGNLAGEIARAAAADRLAVRLLQKVNEGQQCAPGVEHTTLNNDVEGALAAGRVDVVAGTVWLFAREALHGALDAIVVDEAGQMSLANVVAISGAAPRLVLLGDPQQLPQVTKGTHPDGAEQSALGHLLGGHATIPSDRGLFLATTRRLHPEICRFVSEVSYEGRLNPDTACERQALQGALPALQSAGDTAGLRCILIDHRFNRSTSPEEVEAVARVCDELLRASWTGPDGLRRPVTRQDVLVVAPYNAHVARLSQRLPGAQVGTVDRFQGLEGAVAIYSLATSSADDMPRHLEFLYSLNRLNVAVSRARAVAVLVCSPALLGVRCRTPEEMRLANALCRFVELAEEQGTAAAIPGMSHNRTP